MGGEHQDELNFVSNFASGVLFQEGCLTWERLSFESSFDHWPFIGISQEAHIPHDPNLELGDHIWISKFTV